MSERAWTDLIVGDRMAVDQEFAQRVADSEFSRQEWGLIMTAVEFEIENPGDEEAAQLVADTTKVEQVMPELENVQSQMNQLGGGQQTESSRGVFSSMKDALGLGGDDDGVDQERVEAAKRLVQEYAGELQSHLEAEGKWSQVRRTAQG